MEERPLLSRLMRKLNSHILEQSMEIPNLDRPLHARSLVKVGIKMHKGLWLAQT